MPYPLRFQDAAFEHRFAWCWSPLEGRSLRWIPFGMPRLNRTFKNMVFFLYGRSPESGEIVGPLGTGSLIGVEAQTGTWYMNHFYAVTCWHVAIQNGASILRVNTKDGGSRYIELEPHDWQFIPGADDLCVADITERFNLQTDEISFLPLSLFVTKDFVTHEQLEIGEDGFMLGLFAEQPGEKQNFVAARFGNISLLAHDDAPLEQPNGNKRPSHIFDMRSRPGFSGSPVFVYRTPAGDLRSASERGRDKSIRRMTRRSFSVIGGGDFQHVVDRSMFDDMDDDRETHENTFLALLGVHAGQYPERVEARKETRVQPEHDDIIRDRDKLKIPSSMAVVVPSWEIVNLLNLPIFKIQRQKRDERMAAERDKKNIPEPEAIEPPAAADALPASDANPNHREDFNSLVGAAARKPAPKD